MKSTILIVFLVQILLVINLNFSHGAATRFRRQLVPAEFRSINIDTYLNNPRSVQFQLKCLIYNGPCDRIGKFLKVTIPDLITGRCGHCNPSDKQTAGRLIAHIQKNYPKEWNDAVRKFRGGEMVKLEDINRFETLVGVKLDGEVTNSTETQVNTTALPVSTATPAPVSVPVPVSSPVTPVVTPVVSPAAVQPPVQPAVQTPVALQTPVVLLSPGPAAAVVLPPTPEVKSVPVPLINAPQTIQPSQPFQLPVITQ